MADVQKTVAILFQARDEATAALTKIDGALGALGDEAKNATTKASGLDDELKKVDDAVPAVNRLRDAFRLLAASVVVKEFIDANAQIERFELAVTSISGSGTAAASELDYLREVSGRLGLSVRDTSDAWVSLLAATKNTALEGDPARQIFEAVAGAMAQLGRSSTDTEGALLAIQQIISKGTVSSEELRQQLGERLPGAFGIAARAVGVTTAELSKLLEAGELTAQDFLPKFADELNRTFGSNSPIETYTANLNRLKNAWDEFLVTLGKTGLFEALTAGLGEGSKLLTAFGGGIDYLSEVGVAFFNLLQGESLSTFNERLNVASDRARAVSDSLNNSGGLNESLAETNRLARQAAELGAGGFFADEWENETRRLASANKDAEASIISVADAFKTLGVKIDDTKDGANKFVSAFGALLNDPSLRGDQILAGFDAAIKKIKDEDALSTVIEGLIGALQDGRISADEFGAAMVRAQDAQLKIDEATGGATSKLIEQEKQLQKTKESAEKAEQSARDYALEMEKLASNERIKNIEARVALDTAALEAGTQRVQAAFESINVTVEEAYDLLGGLFDLLGDARGSDYNIIRDQIEKENERLDKQLELQEKLVDEQVDFLRAQTNALNRGDALIQVDGAGLQPHLEAFMWEILKTIQVRVNREGLGMLLGV